MAGIDMRGAYSRRGLLKAAVTGAGALSASALLEACGVSPSTSRSSQPSARSAGNAAIGHDTGGDLDVLRVSLPGSLSNLYPGQESGILNYYVAGICMEGLVGVDASGTIVPALASGFEHPSPTTYVYTIRTDAVFHDGSPVTVEDILYSIEMAKDPKVSPSTASYWAGLGKAVKSGPGEITLTSKTPSEAFAWLPANVNALWVAPKAAWQRAKGQIGTATSLLVGSGPYKVTEFAPDSHVEFTRVEGRPGPRPRIARIRFDFIADDNTRLLAWKAGKTDMSLNVPLAQARQWESAARTRVVYAADRSYAGLTFNVSAKPFDDVHVRRAVAHAVNRDAVVSKILRGRAQVATALSTPEQFGGLWTPEQATAKLAAVPQYAYDLEKAKQELAQSSVPGGFTATLSYPSTGPHLGTAALAFAADLKKIGITLDVKELPIEQWLAELNTGPALSYMWYFNTTGDPGELASWFLGEGNPAKYTNGAVAATMAKAAAERDQARRAALLIEAQTAQAADLAYLPLWWGQSATAFTDAIGISDYSSYTLLADWPGHLYPAK
ncbi:ABC transporter substrate-binding protein [Planotetraspora sp. A-T 1434]|uniref:ABC transporter substrate-binding protein n=1 Tax=Planotetraspora sp. A-T 1434 TaxID=2979219 RepID=UPI0021C18709|nr:ABC transporter substrate-binding protein [Planotetraspora sp. A-T 1434]MCT9932138.1 ABC transporter substrate-binding protein [Planotetraspora sp. A-T 1434]